MPSGWVCFRSSCGHDDTQLLGDSETESQSELHDKHYWIRHAADLSVQLQQSSEYWSKKVRELSIDLEKCRQDHHSHMY